MTFSTDNPSHPTASHPLKEEKQTETDEKAIKKFNTNSTISTSRALLIDSELFKMPDMSLVRHVFRLKRQHDNGTQLLFTEEEIQESSRLLLTAIETYHMAPFYLWLHETLNFPLDQKLLLKYQEENEAYLKKLEERLEDAKQNLGAMDVFEIVVEKAIYLGRIGNKDAALTALRVVQEKAATTGSKLDVIFCQIRLGFFFDDHDVIQRNVQKADSMIESASEGGGADWERRNRLKVYKALDALTQRDFKVAAFFLIETLPTFTFTELLSMEQFVAFTVVTALLTVSRPDLYKKVIISPEVVDGLLGLPELNEVLQSLYECRYGDFFQALATIEQKILKKDPWLFPHYRYIVKELKILAFTQYLTSYQSVTLISMAATFGVTQEWLDKELFRWIASGRLDCLMDKVNGTIKMNHFRTLNNHKNRLHQDLLKNGDILLNKLQKLGRVVNA